MRSAFQRNGRHPPGKCRWPELSAEPGTLTPSADTGPSPGARPRTVASEDALAGTLLLETPGNDGAKIRDWPRERP